MIICSSVCKSRLSVRSRSHNRVHNHWLCAEERFRKSLNALFIQSFIPDSHIVNQTFEIFAAACPVCLSNLYDAVISKNAFDPVTAVLLCLLHTVYINNRFKSGKHNIHMYPIRSC